MRIVRTGDRTATETIAVGLAGAGVVVFGIVGFVSGAASTVAYVLSVVILGGVVLALRRGPLPGSLAIALAVDACVHLAGGLVRVGNSGLYNTGFGATSHELHTRLFQYDHAAHTFGSCVAALALWTFLAPPEVDDDHRRALTLLCVLGGMGVGAINELVEFIATLAHAGAHVGGYHNTGWDLVANASGALVGGAILIRHHERLTIAPPAP